MKKAIVVFAIFVLLLIAFFSCFRFAPGPTVEELKGPQVFTGELNTAISKGMYAAFYENQIFYFDRVEKSIKVFDTATGEQRQLCPIETISKIAVNDEYVFFVMGSKIYQVDYSGNLINTSEAFQEIWDLSVLADTLYVDGKLKDSYSSQYSASVNSINGKWTVIYDALDKGAIAMAELKQEYYYGTSIYIETIDEKNRVIIRAVKKQEMGKFQEAYYVYTQNGFAIYDRQHRMIMLDKNNVVYFFEPLSWRGVAFKNTDGMEIRLPGNYNYFSICNSGAPGHFILLGKNFGPYIQSAQLRGYHQSDILLEVDIENETFHTMMATAKGQRIIGYWHGKILLFRDDVISIFDPVSGETSAGYKLETEGDKSSLNLCVLNGYLLVYEDDRCILFEKLAW